MLSSWNIVAASMLAASPAESQKGEEPELGDIVITGERVPRSLRATASSVAVVTATDLEHAAAPDRIEQILASIPNVQIGSGSEGPTIRGQDTTGAMRDLPAFLGGNRPRTTLVVDGRAVSFNEFIFGVAPLWDVERIEVFRSPQTTTQGRNSIAGAIFISSLGPTATWQSRGRAILGDARTRQVSGSLSGPLHGEDIGLRLSADWRKSRPSSVIANRMRGANPNRDEYGSARARLVVRPERISGLSLALTYAHGQSQMPQVEGVRAPFERRRDPLATYGVFRTNVDSMTAALDYSGPKLDNRTVVSIGDAHARRFAPPGLGETRSRSGDFSAETIFGWRASKSLRLSGGAAYSVTALDQRIDLSALSGIGEFEDDQRSLGLFGEATWRTGWAELIAGLRYQRDRQERIGALASTAGPIPLDYRRTFSAWLPKVSLAVDLNRDVRAGVLVQRAHNPGGATLRFDTGRPDEFRSESLWNTELFVRAALAPGWRANINVFQSNLRDAQRSRAIVVRAPTGAPVTFADLYNIDRARSRGAEVEVDAAVTDRLSAKAALGLLGTRITKTPVGAEALLGREFQRSPKMTASASIDWQPSTALQLSAQVRHNAGYFSDDLNSAARRVAGTTIVDARASWRRGPLMLFGYARNLLDGFYLTSKVDQTFATAGKPREVGIGLQAEF